MTTPNPYHKPAGHYQNPAPEIPMWKLTPAQRFELMFRDLDVVEKTTENHRPLTAEEDTFNTRYLEQ